MTGFLYLFFIYILSNKHCLLGLVYLSLVPINTSTHKYFTIPHGSCIQIDDLACFRHKYFFISASRISWSLIIYQIPVLIDTSDMKNKWYKINIGTIYYMNETVRYHILNARLISGIIFIRYSESWKIGKSNKLKSLEAVNPLSEESFLYRN